MYSDLIKIANDVFGKDFVSSLSETIANAKRDFNSRFNFVNGSSFEDKDDYYELTLEVDPDATAKNVTIDLEDSTLTVAYEYKKDGYFTSSKVVETLPADADEETIDAIVENGVVTVTIDKMEEAEEAPEEEEDVKTIKINRK